MHYIPVAGLIRVAFFPIYVSRTPFTAHDTCLSCHFLSSHSETYNLRLRWTPTQMSNRHTALQTDSREPQWTFFHWCRQEFSSWPPCWGLSGFVSWLRTANVTWKRNYTHTFSAWLGCVSHGQNSKTLNTLLLAHAQKHSCQAHVSCFHDLLLTVFYHTKTILLLLTSHTFRSISKDQFCGNVVFGHLLFNKLLACWMTYVLWCFFKNPPLHWDFVILISLLLYPYLDSCVILPLLAPGET